MAQRNDSQGTPAKESPWLSSSQSPVLMKNVQIPDAKTLQHDLSQFLDRYQQEKFLPLLLSIGGQDKVYMEIINHWELAASEVLDGLPQMIRVQHSLGDHGFNMKMETFLCFCKDKTEGSKAWSAYRDAA